MTGIAIGGQRSNLAAVAAATAATRGRPRAALGVIVLAATFVVGAASGIAVGPALQTVLQQATVAGAATSAQAAEQAHTLWLQGEINSYGSAATAEQAHTLWLQGEINSYGSTASAEQAHALWLQGEIDSYGATVSPAQAWLAYRQFRLSEEGYAR